jgi:glycosyltransferase involved in cell wall biosynthesis
MPPDHSTAPAVYTLRGQMLPEDPDISVVVATRDRVRRLEALLASLREQELPAARFEVIVVDDGSADGTADVLAAERERGGLTLHVLAHGSGGGPGAVRNTGWPTARGALVAFTDDDCEADPRWLDALVHAWSGEELEVLQGPATPIEAERGRQGPLTYTYDFAEPNVNYPTCNMAYPKALLRRLDGFDARTFPTTGEDCDLAWRAIAAGARPRFGPEAVVRHAVVHLDRAAMLRRAWRWGDAMPAFARHPELRRQRLMRGRYFNWSHWYLARLLIALALPSGRALWPLRWWLARRYFQDRRWAPGEDRPSARALAWNLAVDSVEMAAVVRGSLRHGTLVL